MTSILILAALLSQQPTPPEKATLSGTVIDSVTGQPLNKVSIVAERIGSRDPGASTTTDAKGEFHLIDMEAGQYRLGLRRNGYLYTHYGAGLASDRGSTINLTPGQKVDQLKAKLVPYGVIGGTIRDSDGDPIIGAAVTIFRSSYEGGRRSIRTYSNVTTTDDRGEYRLGSLPPGKYYLEAEWSRRNDEQPTVDHSLKPDTLREVPLPTFYPGTTDPSTAQPIELPAGARNTGANIQLIRGPLFRVKIHVDSPSALRAGAGLHYAEEGFGEVGHSRTADKGEIEISGVPAGTYTMYVGVSTPPKPFDGKFDVFESSDGCGTNTPVVVAQRDLELRVSAGACGAVTGHVTIEGGKPMKQYNTPYQVSLDGDNRFQAYIRENLFRLPASPGHHNLDLENVTRGSGLYLKSIRSGSLDVLRNGLAIAGGEQTDVEILLSSDGGNIDGVVADADDKPVAGGTVVLIPNDMALRSRLEFTMTATTDQAGHFEIKNAAPGEYKLFAWVDIEKDSWLDPDVLKDVESKGLPVSIKAKDLNEQTNPSQTVNLHAIP